MRTKSTKTMLQKMGLWGILNDQNIALQGPNSAENAIGIHISNDHCTIQYGDHWTGHKIVVYSIPYL